MKTPSNQYLVITFTLAVSCLLTTGCHPTAPKSSKVVADSVAGFSGQQGANGWSYGYWDRAKGRDKN